VYYNSNTITNYKYGHLIHQVEVQDFNKIIKSVAIKDIVVGYTKVSVWIS